MDNISKMDLYDPYTWGDESITERNPQGRPAHFPNCTLQVDEIYESVYEHDRNHFLSTVANSWPDTARGQFWVFDHAQEELLEYIRGYTARRPGVYSYSAHPACPPEWEVDTDEGD